MGVTAIIQARMGSSRLAGKVMKLINGKPVLYYCYNRILMSKKIDNIIIATSILKKDDVIYKYCIENNIKIFRGDENDVLTRFYECVKYFNLQHDTLIRLVCDCPLIDYNIVDNMIDLYHHNKCDIVINTWNYGCFPSGFDAEIFNFQLLEQLYNITVEDREHVTKLVYMSNNYNVLYMGLNKEYIDELDVEYEILHLSLDTEKDFEIINNIICNFEDITFTFYDIMEYLCNNRYLQYINVDDIKKDVILGEKKRRNGLFGNKFDYKNIIKY